MRELHLANIHRVETIRVRRLTSTKYLLSIGDSGRLIEQHRNSNKYLRRPQKLATNWEVKNVLRYCTSTPDMSSREPPVVDPSKPHLICYLADETPLRRDRISTSELHAVVFVATIYYTEPTHHNHSLVPVSPISCRPSRSAAMVPLVTHCHTDKRPFRSPSYLALEGRFGSYRASSTSPRLRSSSGCRG
jgi:hypothetical protein